ncbi:MAG: hypothetical protein KA174_08075 [Chitinophagales bacterium]|nr:hypothetical protein [Chitinophagales bacterium]
MKIYTLIFSLFSAVIVLAMDNNNKNVLTIPIKEHIKLLPEYAKGEIKQYKYSSAKYKMDSLGKIALEDTVHAIIEITNEIKVKDGYLLKWKFIEYFRDTALMSIAEKPSQAALDATIRQTVFKVKYDKDASFEELINEDEIVEIMNNNNEKEKELKSKLSSKNKKADEMSDMMVGLMRYKVLEKGLYPIFSQLSVLYGHTYIEDSLISMDELEKQAEDASEMDEVSKLLAKSLTGGMEKIGGAKMQLDKPNQRIKVQLNSSVDMTEMLKNMSGLFSGMVTEMAGGIAEAFGTDTLTKEQPTKEKIKESKKEIKKEVEKAFTDMEMKVSQLISGEFDYKNKQIISLKQQTITEGKSEGKNMFDSATLYFDVLK